MFMGNLESRLNSLRTISREKRMNPRNGNGDTAWLISADAALAGRIQPLLLPLTGDVRVVDAQEFDGEAFWLPRPAHPSLVILDVDCRLDWGASAIQRLRQARIKAPVVVITKDFSQDFGAKILSEGIKYYLAYDFCDRELRELAASLLRVPPSVSER